MLATWQEFRFGSITKKLSPIPSKSLHETQFVYVDDILKAFKILDAEGFEADGEFKTIKGTIVCLRDGNGIPYDPKRILCYPECVIEVLFETPKSDSTSLALTIAPGSSVSLNESVAQLSIKSEVPTAMDPFEPPHFGLSRKSTMQIRKEMEVATNALIVRNRAGGPLDVHSIVEEILPPEYRKTTATARSAFESTVIHKPDGPQSQGHLTQEIDGLRKDNKEIKAELAKMIKLQETLGAKQDEMQAQTGSQFDVLQSLVQALLTQTYELHEHPIPRLFVVLPQDSTRWNVLDPHIIKTDAIGQATARLQQLKDNIEPRIEQAIDYIKSLSTEDKAVEDFASQMEHKEALEGADLRKLDTFLKDKDENKVFGNLFRTVTFDGHVKWVCIDHYRENYQAAQAKTFQITVDLLGGSFDESIGLVTVTLRSRASAHQLHEAIANAKGILELDITLCWVQAYADFTDLKDMIAASTTIRSIYLNLGFDVGPTIDTPHANRRYDPIFQIMRLPSIRSFEIRRVPKDFFKRSSPLTSDVEMLNLRHLRVAGTATLTERPRGEKRGPYEGYNGFKWSQVDINKFKQLISCAPNLKSGELADIINKTGRMYY
ncbi:hypothetical protein BGZ58_000514, partial [Dissophora ornata]